VKAVKKTASSLEGVDKVEVEFPARIATITMKEGATLSEESLKKAFEGSKFTVEKFEQEGAETAAQAVHKATITGMQ
jgi:copper chaperone CopZ